MADLRAGPRPRRAARARRAPVRTAGAASSRPLRVPPPGSARRWSAAPPACAAAGCCQTYAATRSGNTSRERRANGHWTPIATPPARTTGTTARRPRAAAAAPTAAKRAVSSTCSVGDRPLQRDRVVDRRPAPACRPPRSTCRRCGRRSRAASARPAAVATWKPSSVEHGALRPAQPDRVDLHPGPGRDVGDVERVGARGVLPVGEQDHRGRPVVAQVRPARLERVAGPAVDEHRPPDDRRERRLQPARQRGAALRGEAVDRGEHASPCPWWAPG